MTSERRTLDWSLVCKINGKIPSDEELETEDYDRIAVIIAEDVEGYAYKGRIELPADKGEIWNDIIGKEWTIGELKDCFSIILEDGNEIEQIFDAILDDLFCVEDTERVWFYNNKKCTALYEKYKDKDKTELKNELMSIAKEYENEKPATKKELKKSQFWGDKEQIEDLTYSLNKAISNYTAVAYDYTRSSRFREPLIKKVETLEKIRKTLKEEGIWRE